MITGGRGTGEVIVFSDEDASWLRDLLRRDLGVSGPVKAWLEYTRSRLREQGLG